MFFWILLAFFIIQQMLTIWSVVPLTFLNPAYISEFSVLVLLKPSLKDFELKPASLWNKHCWAVVWAFFGIAFFDIGMETDLFQSCGPCWVFKIYQHVECSTLTASFFRIWNSSAGIGSPPLAFSILMLLRTTWLHTPECPALNK